MCDLKWCCFFLFFPAGLCNKRYFHQVEMISVIKFNGKEASLCWACKMLTHCVVAKLFKMSWKL
jgi:hypothetical protein